MSTELSANIDGKRVAGLRNVLNYYGSFGWELAAIYGEHYQPMAVFKRPVATPAENPALTV